MRGGWALALLFVVVLAAPVCAQAPPLLTDPAGDVLVGDTGQKAPGPALSNIDVRALGIVETDDTFLFQVQMESAPAADQSSTSGEGAYIEFKHNGRSFQLFFGHLYANAVTYLPASLAFRDADTDAWNYLWVRDPYAGFDPNTRTVSILVQRDELADAMGAAPYRGRSFTDLRVESLELGGYLSDNTQVQDGPTPFPVRPHDPMPDTGVADIAYNVLVGPEQSGHALLFSREPFRASNGEATTFLFAVTGVNAGSSKDRFAVRAVGARGDWDVRLPTPVLDLEAGASQEFPVLVTVPFNHIHGATIGFNVEMASASDPASVGRARIGIRYLAIPQPAGHHDTLFLHGRIWDSLSGNVDPVHTGNAGYVVMNALETDPDESTTPMSPQRDALDSTVTPPVMDASWCIRLNPGLQLGLDFDTKGTGVLAVPVTTTAPIQGAIVTGRLLLQAANSTSRGTGACYFDTHLAELATVGPTTAQDLAPQGSTVLQANLAISPDADLVPYVRGQDLLLELHIRGVSPPNPGSGTPAPKIVPGGTLKLPLFEYHDPQAGVFLTSTGLAVHVEGDQERRANPGATVVFPVSATNDGTVPAKFTFNMTGTNLDWVTLPATLAVEPGQTGNAQVVVKVPSTAKAGIASDAVVEVRKQGNLTASALLRLVVVADATPGLQDDAPLVAKPEEKSSPAPALAFGLLFLGAAAVLRRRR